jgi:hypothetical protein
LEYEQQLDPNILTKAETKMRCTKQIFAYTSSHTDAKIRQKSYTKKTVRSLGN